MSTFYPSDEYDSFDLEHKRTKRRFIRWQHKRRPDDDDDDPPTAPVALGLPRTPPLADAAQAA